MRHGRPTPRRSHRPAALAAAAGLLATAPAVAVAAGGELDVRFPQRTIVVDGQGRFSVPVACDDLGPSCEGDIRLFTTSQEPGEARVLVARGRRQAATRLGLARIALGAGEDRRVTVRLNAAGRRALARRRGKEYVVRARVRQLEATGRFRGTMSVGITLRAAR